VGFYSKCTGDVLIRSDGSRTHRSANHAHQTGLQALSAKDAVQSAKFADRTFDLLGQMVTQGYSDADQHKSDPDFASLHPDPRFTELLAQLEAPATYAALWRADVEFESKLLTGVPVDLLLDELDLLLDELKPLIAQGFRPFAIATAPVVAGLPPVVAGLPTEPPPLTAGLPSSASTGGVGRPAVVGRAGSGDPRTTAWDVRGQETRAQQRGTCGVRRPAHNSWDPRATHSE